MMMMMADGEVVDGLLVGDPLQRLFVCVIFAPHVMKCILAFLGWLGGVLRVIFCAARFALEKKRGRGVVCGVRAASLSLSLLAAFPLCSLLCF